VCGVIIIIIIYNTKTLKYNKKPRFCRLLRPAWKQNGAILKGIDK